MILKDGRFQLKDEIYGVLKWLCLIALPALSVLISVVFKVWDIPYALQITTTINAVAVFIGALIGVSQISYNASQVAAATEDAEKK